MSHFTRNNIYMEGDILDSDVPCQQKPSPDYLLNNGAWVFDTVTVKANVLDIARTLRVPIMTILDGLQSSANTNGNIALALQIEALKVGLRNITALDLSSAQTKEQALKLIVDNYKLLAAAAPASIRADFLEVLTKAQKI